MNDRCIDEKMQSITQQKKKTKINVGIKIFLF